MNFIETEEELKSVKARYKISGSYILSRKTSSPISLSPNGMNIRLTTSPKTNKKQFDVRYIRSLLGGGVFLMFIMDDIKDNYTLSKDGDIIIKHNGNIATPQNVHRTCYRLTINGVRQTIQYHQIVHAICDVVLKKAKPMPKSKPMPMKKDSVGDVAFAKIYMSHYSSIKSDYTAGIAPIKYAGPVGDIVNFGAIFRKVKLNMFNRNRNGIIAQSTDAIVDDLMKSCDTLLRNQLTAWVELHKFKARRGELTNY